MIEFDTSTCRICLEDGAIYPIFESNEEFESVYAKLAVCLQEKLEDLKGYPRYICTKCKNTSDTICDFISKYEKSSEILKTKILPIKLENPYGSLISYNESEPFIYELQTEYEPIEPKVEKIELSESQESLSHLSVNRAKAESLSNEIVSNKIKNKVKRDQPKNADCESREAVNKHTKRKSITNRSSPKKTALKTVKKGINKLSATKNLTSKAKKAVAIPVSENNGACMQSSTDSSKQEAVNDKGRDLKRERENEEKQSNNALLCNQCGATFHNKINLYNHMKSTHTEGKYKCTKCPREFHDKWHFDYHNNRHDNITPFTCDICGKSFHARKAITGHIRVVHNKRKKYVGRTYKCQYCDQTYKYKSGVIIHERSAHTGERPEVCNICGGSFYHKMYLTEHMRLHTGDAPYKCPVCARGYAQCGNMKSHMRNHKLSELDPHTRATIKPSLLKFMRP